jgi:hypothetical protein
VGLTSYTIPSRHTSTYTHHKDVVITFDLYQVCQCPRSPPSFYSLKKEKKAGIELTLLYIPSVFST